MLEPQDRRLLLDALRPPDGFALDLAIGTSFSLDLLALLATPLAFTLFDIETDDGAPTSDPLALLEALRRHASRITVFCQAGQIVVPPHDRLLYGYLEDSVVEVVAPRGGVFHPKVWLLKFASVEEPARYRLLCASRNLTFDRAWDTLVCLDGELAARRNAFGVNHPLGDFVARLPALAVGEITAARREAIASIAEEVRRVRWELPEGFDAFRFWPLGHGDSSPDPFDTRIDRLMVVSPFISGAALRSLARGRAGNVLVSRLETLQELEPDDLEGYDDVRVLNDRADPEPDAEADSDDSTSGDQGHSDLVGLHAKVYVADQGWDATVWIGSANATTAAFARNVEFMVELSGRKRVCGIDAVLSGDADVAFGALLSRFDRGDAPSTLDHARRALERQADTIRYALAACRLESRVAAADTGEYDVVLCADEPFAGLLGDAVLRAWPVTQSESLSRPVDPEQHELCRFTGLAVEMLTPFVAFQLGVERGGQTLERRFVVRTSLVGAPADREQRLFRALLGSRAEVLRYLMLLLADDAAAVLEALTPGAGFDRATAATLAHSGRSAPVLFEPLMRAIEQAPESLDRIAHVVRDLEADGDGAYALLPEGFEAIWAPIARAREELGR